MSIDKYKDQIHIEHSVGGFFPVWIGHTTEWDDDGKELNWYREDFCLGQRFATEQEAIDYVEKYYPQKDPEENYYTAVRAWKYVKDTATKLEENNE